MKKRVFILFSVFITSLSAQQLYFKCYFFKYQTPDKTVCFTAIPKEKDSINKKINVLINEDEKYRIKNNLPKIILTKRPKQKEWKNRGSYFTLSFSYKYNDLNTPYSSSGWVIVNEEKCRAVKIREALRIEDEQFRISNNIEIGEGRSKHYLYYRTLREKKLKEVQSSCKGVDIKKWSYDNLEKEITKEKYEPKESWAYSIE